MGYVFDFNDAVAYDQWFNNPRNCFTFDLQTGLMLNLLKPLSGERILDIGCGTGAGLRVFLDRGLQVTGIDPSLYMLDIASRNLGNRVDLHRGFAEDLPFDDNSFNYVTLFTTLEFVDDPLKAIEEASRVAKNKLFIGALNRYSIKGIQRRIKGIFIRSIYNHAAFFSVWELKRMIHSLLGDVPISWRTMGHFSSGSGWITRHVEKTALLQWCPCGAFIGMVVTLVPRYKTTPLTVPYKTKPTTGAIA